MKNLKTTVTLFIIALLGMGIYSFTQKSNTSPKCSSTKPTTQHINMFVTHGHCSTPFGGKVENLNLFLPNRPDGGNPMEGMTISFDLNPIQFTACAGEEYSKQVQTPGLFRNKDFSIMHFASTDIYTMGIDWYQINGILTIKGVDKKVKFFVSGIRESNAQMAHTLIFESRIDLLDWGIDYDQVVFGKTTSTKTQWMHLNMKLKV